MGLTQLSVVIVALSVVMAVAVLVWRWRVHRVNRESPEAHYRRDIQALRRPRRIRVTERGSDDVWSAGAGSDPPHSRAKRAATWAAVGTVGGCGGCGGCGG